MRLEEFIFIMISNLNMEKPFRRILVALNGSDASMRGLDFAISIAKAGKAKITGLYVFHLPALAGIKLTEKMRDEAQEDAAKSIGPALARANQMGADFKYHTKGGYIGKEIVEYAEADGSDMIIVGGGDLKGARAAFMGSVANYVVHQASVPVAVIK